VSARDQPRLHAKLSGDGRECPAKSGPRAPEAAPEGCVLRVATLRLYAAAPGEYRTLQVVRLASAWTESSVRWDNQPAPEGAASSIASGADQGYREWRVTAQVAEGAPHGFLVQDALEGDSGEQALHAREKGENPPELALRYGPPPDPAQGPLPPMPAEVTCGQEIVASTLDHTSTRSSPWTD